MKILYLLFAITFYLSCNSENTECVVCKSEGETIGVNLNLDGILSWYVPNIILTDFPNVNYLGLEISLTDTINFSEEVFPPDSIYLKVFNSKNQIIYIQDEVVQDSINGYFYLWDGFYDNNEHLGRFTYELYMGFENNQFINFSGTSFSTTCAILKNCSDPDADCDLSNCRFFPRLYNGGPGGPNC